MGCVTCSSGRGNSNVPAGCNNNGSCGTGGCNKLNVFDWLADIHLPGAQAAFDIVEIRFKNSRKEFFKNTANLQLKVGDIVAVEASPGHDIGIVALTGELVRLQLKKNNVKDDEQFKTIYRIAKQTDIEKWHKAIEREKATMMRSRTIALELKLVMKISDVEFQGDGSKATFFYTADDRVDFRELIKIMAEEFRVRIEMRQIGARQEAARLGGIGSCGRELCCSSWLKDFRSVNTSAARYQQLSLNPQKLAGQCGKLKCCLNYELDSYLDAIKDFPDTSINLESKKGRAFHQKTDIFKRQIWYAYTSEPSNFIALDVDRVKHILELNKKGEFPDDLKDFEKMIVQEKKPDYENVVGQDSLTRFDQKRNKKKKKKKRNPDQRKENSTNA
jgi:cell fate regulator YaaT (PSP1 superfamily)